MDCPSCGASVPAGRFCIECGAAFERRCDSCGHANDPSAKFCAECGHRLTPSEPAPPATPQQRQGDAERRQLTVMFVDLVGSTALSSKLDPEEMREVIRAYQNAVAGEITRFEGHVAKFMGDGVLAYFGWPRAHEDEAERAVRAGLAITAAIGQLSNPAGEALAARVGIATGLVVVGDLVGEGAAQEQAVVGDTPNFAARLQGIAAPGQVVIADATRRLLGAGFELEDLGEHDAQGDRRAGAGVRGHRRAAGRRAASRRRAARRCCRWSGATRSWRCCSSAGRWPRPARARACSWWARPGSASRGSPRRCSMRSPSEPHTASATSARPITPTARSGR